MKGKNSSPTISGKDRREAERTRENRGFPRHSSTQSVRKPPEPREDVREMSEPEVEGERFEGWEKWVSREGTGTSVLVVPTPTPRDT